MSLRAHQTRDFSDAHSTSPQHQVRKTVPVTRSFSRTTVNCGTRSMCSSTDLTVSPSPQTQMCQWQLSISCTGSGTRTSLGFSAIEKHWKIRSSHRFDGVYATKIEKLCAWGTWNTDSRFPERIDNRIYFILFPKPKQTQQNVCKHSTLIPMKTKTFIL